MDWFLYDNGLRHERVKHRKFPKDHNLMKNQRQRYEASLMKVLNPLIKHFRTK